MDENRHTLPSRPDDEISLVDLALILIKRRWWVMGTAVLVFVVAVVFAFMQKTEPVYRLVTLYDTAQYADQDSAERSDQRLSGKIQRIESVYWPAVQRDLTEEQGTDNHGQAYELEVSNPNNTGLISLTTQASAADRSTVEQIHRDVLAPVISAGADELDNRQSMLQAQLARLQAELDQSNAQASNAHPQLFVQYSEQVLELEAQLAQLGEGEVVQYAALGERTSQGPGSGLILALGFILAGFLGLMAGFFAEFGARVRQAMKEQKDQA